MNLEAALAIVLRKRRTEYGLSQEELAYMCDVDRTYISLLERQKRKPTLNVLFKICKTLEIQPSDFIKEIEQLLQFEK